VTETDYNAHGRQMVARYVVGQARATLPNVDIHTLTRAITGLLTSIYQNAASLMAESDITAEQFCAAFKPLITAIVDYCGELQPMEQCETNAQDTFMNHFGQLNRSALLHKLRGSLSESANAHDIIAEALGYSRGSGGPNDPTGGGFITGDHTLVSLASEIAHRYAELFPKGGDDRAGVG